MTDSGRVITNFKKTYKALKKTTVDVLCMPGSKYQRDIFLIQLIFKCQFSFFSSDAFDNELIMKTLWKILQGKTVQIPVYDFVTHSRWALFHSPRHVGSRCVHGITIKLELFIIFFLYHFRKDEFITVYPADVVLFEGILMFYSQEIRDVFQMKLFVDTDPDTRLSRRGVYAEPSRRAVSLQTSKYHRCIWIDWLLCVFFFFCFSLKRHQWARERAGAGPDSVHYFCETGVWRILFTSE